MCACVCVCVLCVCVCVCVAPCTVIFLCICWSAAIFFMCHYCHGHIHRHHSYLFSSKHTFFISVTCSFTTLNHHHDCHHHCHHLHHRWAFLSASGKFHAPTEEYLSLLVLSEFSRTPVFIPTEQPDQPFQFPQPDMWRGLRNWVCRWWEQHFWGQPESEGLFVSSQESWSTRQQHEPVQLLVASSASSQWDQAKHYRLQWGCFSGGWEFTPLLTCRAASAQTDDRYGLHRR